MRHSIKSRADTVTCTMKYHGHATANAKVGTEDIGTVDSTVVKNMKTRFENDGLVIIIVAEAKVCIGGTEIKDVVQGGLMQ